MATPEALQEYERLSIDYVRSHQAEIQQLLNNQRTLESEIIQRTNSFCPLEQIKNRTVSSEDIQRALQEGFGDANVLKSLMCLNNSILALPPSGMERSFRIRHYLENLKQIGGESVEGYAMTADVRNKNAVQAAGAPMSDGKNLFVAKAPRRIDPTLRANQIHEYFVGAFGTNTLRSKIPNFSFLLALFQGSPPYIDSYSYAVNEPVNRKDRRALTFCQNDVTQNQVNYLLYENITNSTTLKDFIIKGCTFEQYLNILIQLVLAIDLAYRECDFTHYDLHDENVLVRELPQEILIPYEIDGVKQYLRTKYIATIIDFGRSHIKFEGNDFGYALIEGGIFPNRSYPMYDIYKILLFTLASAAFGESNMMLYAGLTDDQVQAVNPDVFQNAKKLVSYFNPQLEKNNVTNELITSANYLVQTRRFFYSLPYSPQFDGSTIKFFQNGIIAAYPSMMQKIFQSSSSDFDQVYGCANKGICYSLEQAIMEYSKPDVSYIDDAYTFYELALKAQQEGNLAEVMSQGEPRYESYMNQLRNDRNKYTNELNQITQGYTIVSLRMGAPDDVKFQDAFLDLYRRFIAKSVRLVDLLTLLAQTEMVVRTLNELYPNKAQQIVPGNNYTYANIPQMEFDPIRQSVSGMNEVIVSIKEDVAYIQTLNQRQVLQMNPEAIWLFQKMPTLVAAITQL